MFCIHCGKELPDDAKFCNACGKPTQKAEAPTPKKAKNEKIEKILEQVDNGSKRAATTVKTKIAPQAVSGVRAFAKLVGKKFSQLSKGKRILVLVLGIALLLTLALVAMENRTVVRIPDPEDFFGVRGYETSGGSDINLYFQFEEDPSQMLDAYIAAIAENAKDSKQIHINKIDGKDPRYDIVHGGFWLNGELLLRIINYGDDYYGADSGKYVVFFRAENNAKMEHWDAYEPDGAANKPRENLEEPNQTVSEPLTQTEPVVTVSGPTLPGPGAFLGNPAPVMDEPEEYSGWVLYYELDIDEGWIAGTEYVELIKNSEYFELRDSFSDTVWALYSEYYFFDYVGDEILEPASGRYYKGGYQDFTSDLFIRLQRVADKGYSTIQISYSNDLAVVDLGDRASTVPENNSNSENNADSGDDSEPYKPDFAKEPCMTCWGDKKCDRCNGYGKIERDSKNNETITSDCPDCVGGKCPTCNGTGTRE